MASFYSGWVASDDWRLRLDVTESLTETQCTYTARLYLQSTYMTAKNTGVSWSITIDGTERSGTNDSPGISPGTTRQIASASKTVARGTSKKTVSFRFSAKSPSHGVSAYRKGTSGSGSASLAAKRSYAVRYDANGGAGAPGGQTKWYGTSLKLSSTKPTRTGHTFDGWATSATGPVAYKPGATYTGNAALTLYAVWKPHTYAVRYDANGGEGAPPAQTKTYGRNLALSAEAPTRRNYDFLGWGTSANSTTVAYAPGATYTGNAAITLYAVWKLAWVEPQVTNFQASRCDSSGELDEEGAYARVGFAWRTDKDVSSISVECGGETTPVEASGTSGSVEGLVVGGALSVEEDHVVTLRIADAIDGIALTTVVPSMKFIMDVAPNGSVSFGEPADPVEKRLDVHVPASFAAPATFGETVLLTKGVEGSGKDGAVAINVDSGEPMFTSKRTDTGVRVKFGVGSGGKNHGVYTDVLGGWMIHANEDGVYVDGRRVGPRVLWEGEYYMTDTHTVGLSEKVSDQMVGIVLTFGGYTPGEGSHNYEFHHFFVPKTQVAARPGAGSTFLMAVGNSNPTAMAFKYLYINDRSITGHANNTKVGTSGSGVKIANNKMVLRMVTGV